MVNSSIHNEICFILLYRRNIQYRHTFFFFHLVYSVIPMHTSLKCGVEFLHHLSAGQSKCVYGKPWGRLSENVTCWLSFEWMVYRTFFFWVIVMMQYFLLINHCWILASKKIEICIKNDLTAKKTWKYDERYWISL